MKYFRQIKIRTLAKAVLIALVFTADCSLLTADCLAQAGKPHYKSPLYSPRGYEESKAAETVNGIPEVLKKVGIEQKLNAQLPLDAKFFDENGQEVELGKYFGKKPIIIALVYYECPMLCNEVLNGLVSSLKPLSFDAGKEFDVVAISFDAREKPELAKAKKESYMARYNRAGTENGFHFLTGTQESIDKVTEAVGFYYQWDEKSKQFAHAGGVQVATPEGKLARYYYGIEYAPKEIKFGLIEAADNKIGNPVDQLLLYCYHYDPASGKYGFAIMNVLRLTGILTVVGMVAMIFVLRRYKINKRVETEKTA